MAKTMAILKLSKSDFLDFRHCAKSFWLKQNNPGAISWPAPGAFDRMLMKDGYKVEAEAKRLVASWRNNESCTFQRILEDENLFARADLVRENPDGSLDIYEIKGSTSLKSASGDDHIDDACFQTIVAERAGHTVSSVFIIHADGDYVREGEIDPGALLTIVDVTKLVRERKPSIEIEVEQALELMLEESIDEKGCSCRQIGSRDKQCASFDYFNPDISHPSAYFLPRISKKRLIALDDEGRLAIEDMTEDDITKTQLPVLRALTTGQPVINRDGISAFIDALSWPLHFYDYETFASAVPIADGHRPQQAMPVQFSLHKLHEDGKLDHFEYLATRPGQQAELVEALQEGFSSDGSAIVWNQSFEMSCNKRMAELLPSAAAFLEDVNERTADLMDVFKADYVDRGFEGSTSIKKVLPVLCPHLEYAKDAVHDGGGAMEAWINMVNAETADVQQQLAEELLAYCKLDSLAMVEIFRFLQKI